MTLSRKILIASLVPFLAVIGLYHVLSTIALSRHLAGIYRQQAESVLLRLEEDILNFLKQNADNLHFLADNNPPDQTQPTSSKISLNGLLLHAESIFQVSAINANGAEWLRVRKFPSSKEEPLFNLFSSPIYQGPMLNLTTQFGEIIQQQHYPLPFMNISVPIQDRQSGQPKGVLWGEISFQGIQCLLEHILPSHGKVALIRTVDSKIIASADDTRVSFADLEVEALQEAMQNPAKNDCLEKKRGARAITFVYRKFTIGDNDLLLLYYQPNDTIYFLTNSLKRYNLYLILAGIGLFVMTKFFLVRRITAPLAALSIQIRELCRQYYPEGEAEPNGPKLPAGDETEQLASMFTYFQVQLNGYREWMEGHNLTLKEEVDIKTAQLIEVNKALQKANESMARDIAHRKVSEEKLER